MKITLIILTLLFSLSASAQLSKPQVWYFRHSNTQGKKPVSGDFPKLSTYAYNVQDSILWSYENGVITEKYTFYPYAPGYRRVHLVNVTSEGRYNAPFYQNSVKTTSNRNYTILKSHFTSANTLIINWGDSTASQLIRGVVTNTWRIYQYDTTTITPPTPPTENNYINVATSGNDTTGDGSYLNPYRSPYKASTIAGNGDTIYIHEGIYQENRKCSFVVGVSLMGDGKFKTIIKSNYNGATYLDALFTFYSATVGATGNNNVFGIGFDGINYTSDLAIAVINRSNVKVHDCDFTNFLDGPATFHGTNYEYYREPATYCTGNKFYNNTVNNCSTYNSNFQGLWFSGQDQFEVYGCNFQNLKGGTSGDAISSKTNKRWYIHDNIINRLPYQAGYWNFAVEIRWNYGECRYYNNQVTGGSDFCWNYSNGYDYSIDVYNCLFGHSLTSSSTVWNLGIDFEADNYDLRVRNNTFKNLACGILYSISFTSTPVKLDGLTLTNNLFDNIGSPTNLSGYYEACIYILPGQNNHTVKNLFIYNNTFKQAAYSKGCMTLGGQGTQTNIKVRNNIVSGFSTAPVSIAKTNSGSLTIDTLTITHNNFFGNANSNNVLFTSITPTNYTTNNILKLNPLFVSGTDYNLQSGSPCKNTGIDLGYGLNIGAY